MLFWCLILVVFAFLSLSIDIGWLSFSVFRHIWDLLLLGLGVMLFVRVKGKENQGLLEHLEIQIDDLSHRIENQRTEAIWRNIDDLEKRMRKIENRLNGQ